MYITKNELVCSQFEHERRLAAFLLGSEPLSAETQFPDLEPVSAGVQVYLVWSLFQQERVEQRTHAVLRGVGLQWAHVT